MLDSLDSNTPRHSLDNWQLCLHHVDTTILHLTTHTIVLGSSIMIALDIDLNILALSTKNKNH